MIGVNPLKPLILEYVNAQIENKFGMDDLGQLTDYLHSMLLKAFPFEESKGKTLSTKITPILMGAMLQKVENPSDLSKLTNRLNTFKPEVLKHLDQMVTSQDTFRDKPLFTEAGKDLSFLLEDKKVKVVALFGDSIETSSEKAEQMLQVSLPLTMSWIANHLDEVNESSLKQFLSNKEKEVTSQLEEPLVPIFGLASRNSAKETIHFEERLSTSAQAPKMPIMASGLMKWLIPLTMLVGIAYFFSQNSTLLVNRTENGAAQDSVQIEKITNATNAQKVRGMLAEAFSIIDEGAKKALDGISFTANSAGSNLLAYIDQGKFNSDSTFRFNDLKFETGSAAIEPGSGEEVDNLAAILKAYPSINATIEGHTDDVGDASTNKELSQERAASVKKRLVDRGVAENRLEAIGFGSEKPIASNETEEGRAENRRVQVKIRKGN